MKRIVVNLALGLLLFTLVFHMGACGSLAIKWNREVDYGNFTDSRDDRIYRTVTIGQQTWMAENLKYPLDYDSWLYDEESSVSNLYGRLYTWWGARMAAPPGWHVPTQEEWQELIGFLGGEKVAGGKLKEVGISHWNSPNNNASNESGFTALPGGNRTFDEKCQGIGDNTHFWTATGLDSREKEAWGWFLLHNSTESFSSSEFDTRSGFSVRCVKDSD